MKPRVTVTVDLLKIRHNIELLRRCSPTSKLLIVVKANGYGHYADKVIEVLKPEDGVAVARLDEAIKLREKFPKIKIVLLSGFLDEDELLVAESYQLDLVVHQKQQIEILQYLKLKKQVTVWLKVDIGMRRLGIENNLDQAVSVLADNENVKEVIMMGHLSSADDLTGPETPVQIEKFNNIAGRYDFQSSLANSAGILYWRSSHSDWNRPGLAVYGINPVNNIDLDLRPAMQLHGIIIGFKLLEAGDRLGYGLAHCANSSTLIAVVSVGYGDGYPRCSSDNNQVWIAGQAHRIVGRISMDSTFVDITGRENLKLGDKVEFWGSNISIMDVAKNNNTIPYELIIGLTSRVNFQFKS